MENKQTAVEYLIQSINERIRTLKYWNEINEFVEKAKAMEKAQMEELKDFEKWKEWKNSN